MRGVGAALALRRGHDVVAGPTAALFALSGVFLGPFTGALFTTRQTHAPEAVRAQLFTISAGLKTTAAAAGAALGGSIAHLLPNAQLLLLGSSPFLAGALGILALATARHQ